MNMNIDPKKPSIIVDNWKFGMVNASAMDDRKIPKESAETLYNIRNDGTNLNKRKGRTKVNSVALKGTVHDLYYWREEI